MAVLSIQWGSVDRVAPATAEITPADEMDEEGAEAPQTPRMDRPMIVWVDYEGSEDGTKIKKIALDPDKVRVGSNWFRCVKMTPEAAAQDALISDAGKEVPRMVFVSTDYEVVKVVEKKISGKTIYSAMQKTAKKSFKANFDKSVKSMIKLLNEFDKIANERENLEAKEKKGLKKSEEKKIAKEKEELEKRQKDADEQKAELMKLELRIA